MFPRGQQRISSAISPRSVVIPPGSRLPATIGSRERPIVAGNRLPGGITTERGEIADVRKPRKAAVTNIAFRRVRICNAEHGLPERLSKARRGGLLAHSCKADVAG